MNDVALAIYSDRLFMGAVGVYVLAMVLHTAEYATLRTARVPATAYSHRPIQTRVPFVGTYPTRVPFGGTYPTRAPLVRNRRLPTGRRGPGPTGSAGRR